VREPDRFRRNQGRAVRHCLQPAAALPFGLDQGELGAAVDARHLPGLRFDHHRAFPLGGGQHDDVGKIIFAGRIVVADLAEQREQILGTRRHKA